MKWLICPLISPCHMRLNHIIISHMVILVVNQVPLFKMHPRIHYQRPIGASCEPSRRISRRTSALRLHGPMVGRNGTHHQSLGQVPWKMAVVLLLCFL